ncbi:cytochrome P450 [Nocardia farcinica]|uniref:cytochrome P450 n=1 Tax=Nocardia farcinica TaxID=37329 RepID=UPI0015F0ED0F|nr:cytochrome P450 [Nocardia farcinica]MBA4854267.1 cytochrome P450 [Nocardia farcinica]MBC9814452.1 cytochrome P450 [Nocardia farcinica]
MSGPLTPASRPSTYRGAPVVDVDLYGRQVVTDPQSVYRRIRDAGPLVWLPRHRLWAMGRFDDVRAALRDDLTFRSGNGVAANPIANTLGHYTTLASDDRAHTNRRAILMQSLASPAIRPALPAMEQEAVATVERLRRRQSFDGIADFATRLPVQVVADLVGVRVSAAKMLTWGRATFDGLGPANPRAGTAATSALRLYLYTLRLRRKHVTPHGWAASVFDAADRGRISRLEAKNMIIDFVAPSLDTTILATGQLLWSLGAQPEVWEQIRADPALIPRAVIEAVRLASPVRAFTRTIAVDTVLGEVALHAGERVALIYAAANSDERRFDRPEQFSLDRRGSNLGWGNGAHTCVGMQLAKMEMQTLLHAMVPRINHISVSDPQPLHNNCLQGLKSFRAAFH